MAMAEDLVSDYKGNGVLQIDILRSGTGAVRPRLAKHRETELMITPGQDGHSPCHRISVEELSPDCMTFTGNDTSNRNYNRRVPSQKRPRTCC